MSWAVTSADGRLIQTTLGTGEGMNKLHSNEVHERRHRRVLNRHELESIIGNVVHHEIRDEFGPDVDVDAVDYKLTFEDETEGSPGYKVGTRCIVDVVERLKPSK